MEKVRKLKASDLPKLDSLIREYRGDDFGLSFAHGVVTAILSAPEIIHPGVLFEYVFNLEEDESEILLLDEVKEHFILFLSFYSEIAKQLVDRTYKPLLSLDKDYSESSYEWVNEWALGYLSGVYYYMEEGNEDEKLIELLAPITTLAGYEDFIQEKNKTGGLTKSVKITLLNKFFEGLPDVVLNINQYNRSLEAGPEYFTGNKIGRNDPCPCGSGKKYKKCCGR